MNYDEEAGSEKASWNPQVSMKLADVVRYSVACHGAKFASKLHHDRTVETRNSKPNFK